MECIGFRRPSNEPLLSPGFLARHASAGAPGSLFFFWLFLRSRVSGLRVSIRVWLQASRARARHVNPASVRDLDAKEKVSGVF